MSMLIAISLCFVGAVTTPSPKVLYLSAYPKLMTYAGVSGQVDLDISIGKTGEVISIVTVTTENDKNKALIRHANSLMKRWKFTNSSGLETSFRFKIDYILLPEDTEDDDHYEVDPGGVLKVYSKRKIMKDIDRFH